MDTNVIPTKIISNRKLCQDLTKQVIHFFEGCKNSRDFSPFKIESFILREKDLPEEEYRKLVREICPVCKKNAIDFYVHTFWRLGIEEGVENIHLPLSTFKEVVKCKENREEFFEKYKSVGISVHSVEEAKEAEAWKASYVFAGHIFPTACKKDLEPRGLSFLENICKQVGIPVYALGGIGESNAHLALEQGAYGVGIMSLWMREME